MKAKKKGLIALWGIWLLTIFTLTSVSAYRGDPSIEWPNYSTERHDAMLEIFETNDYEGWKELMKDRGRVTEVITAENFDKFVEAHNLALDWKIEEAKAIREELWLGLRNWNGRNRLARWMWRWMWWNGQRLMDGSCNE